MKKRLLSIALVLALCLTILPAAAFAAESWTTPKKDYLDNGKLSTAEAPYVVRESSPLGDEMVLYYFQTPELQEMALDIQRRGAEFWETYDLTYLTTFIQIDVKFDNGKWLSEIDDWDVLNDWGDVDFSEGIASDYAFFLRAEKASDSADKLQRVTHSDLYHFDSEFSGYEYLKPYVKSVPNEYGDDVYRFDLDNHTISYRIRFGVNYLEHEYDENEKREYFFGGWSPVTSIGKNGTQETLVAPAKLDAPVLSQFSLVTDDDGNANAQYFFELQDSVYAAEKYHLIMDNAFEPLHIQAQLKVNGGEWQDAYTANPTTITNGFRVASSGNIKESDKVQVRVRIETSYSEGNSEWSNVIGNVAEHQADAWAQGELAAADALGLIPDVLVGQDLTQPITRAEFAAVAVKAYEALSGEAATPVANNPFTDTTNVDVLKAYNLDLINGYGSLTIFAPDVSLNREMAATLLTRVYKKIALPGWTLGKDGDFKLNYTKPAAFADDKYISGYAYDSVYFMASKNIIKGITEGGKTLFKPNNTTSKQEAETYAQSTRQEAIIIAKRMVENL